MTFRQSLSTFIFVLSMFGGSAVLAGPDTYIGPPSSILDTVQGPYLTALKDQQIPVSIYLVNGIKLQGVIVDFDDLVIVLNNTVDQLLYKSAISQIVPSRAL